MSDMTYATIRRAEILGSLKRKPHRDSRAVLMAVRERYAAQDREARMGAAARRLERVWR